MFLKRFIKSSSKDDTSLMHAYAETGKLSYLGELYDRYMPLVYGVCLKYLQDEEASKDAVMHIFEKLVVRLKEENISNFKSWLYVVTKNHCLMALRAKKKVNGHEDINRIPEADYAYKLLDEPGDEAQWQVIEQGMQSLPAEQQQCIRLFYLEQKTYKDIVVLTGYDIKKVKSYIQNGKRNLKMFVNRHYE